MILMKNHILTSLFLFVAVAAFAQGKLDRSKVPTPGPAPAIQIGKYEMGMLDNGLRVIVVENRKLPRISWNIRFTNDPVLEGKKKGYVEMAGNLVTAGTTTRTKAQIDERVDYLGAELSGSSSSLYAASLTRHSDDLLELMQDVLLNPSFPENEIDKLRKQLISGLASERTSPNAISGKIAAQVKYGTSHPYGEYISEQSVSAVTREDLLGYYQTYFRPNIAYLVVVGDISFKDALKKAEKYFGEWDPAPVSRAKYNLPLPPRTNTVVFVPVPGAVQSVIDITYPIDLKPGTIEAIQASLLNNILGGSGFQSRLMQNLREDKAYTYGAYSSISPDEFVGSFSAECNVRNEVTDSSITEILREMRRLVTEEVDEAILQTVKNILTGNFARSLERPQTVANFAYNIQKYNLPADYYETYLQKLNAVTVADVQAIARKLIKPENAYITVVGNREVVPLLSQFSTSGKVEMYNVDGQPLIDLKPAPAGMTSERVLASYIKAIGGEKAIKKIKSYEVKGKMDLGMMVLELNRKVLTGTPGKSVMVVNMQGMEAMKQVFDGTSLVQYQMGQKGPGSDGETAEARIGTDLLAELNYSKYGVNHELKGIDQIDGKSYYVVELKLPGGATSTDYFDVTTGLRFRSIETSVNEGTTTVAEKTYSEYLTTKSKVLFPKVVRITAEGQTFNMVTNEVVVNPKIAPAIFEVK